MMAKSLNKGIYKYNKGSVFIVLKDSTQDKFAEFETNDVYICCVDRYRLGHVYQYKFEVYQGNSDFRKEENRWHWSSFKRKRRNTTTFSFPKLIQFLKLGIIEEREQSEFAKYLLEEMNGET